MSNGDDLDPAQLQRELAQYSMPGAASAPDQAGADEADTDPADPTPTPVQAVALDDATIALAQQAARAPWYASWVTGALIPGGPALGLLMGIYGSSSAVRDWSELGIVLLFIFGPVIGIIWLAMYTGHRGRVKYVRRAIGMQRAWALEGPLDRIGGRMILAGNRELETVHHFRIPGWARTAQCRVIFADADVGAAQDSASSRGVVITITGPDGHQMYPPTRAIPTLFQVRTLIASILFSLAFTAACNAQSQSYGDAATRLRDITAATQCTPTNKPGEDCWTWMSGTITYEGYYSTTSLNGSTSSTCRSVLRWANKRQEGDLRIDGIDCTKQLTASPMPARIQVLRDYAIQVQVGLSTYQTDRWPPLGDTVLTLALVFKMAVLGWVAWPMIHIGAAVMYRLRQRIRA